MKIKDLFVDFKGDTTLRFGNFKVMNGLEQPSSLYATTFMEANAVSKVNGLSRALGVGLYRSFGNVHLSGGVFGSDVNDISDKDTFSTSARIAFEQHPQGDDSLLHLGASTRYRKSGDSTVPFSYSQKPVAPSSPKTINTGKIADSDVFVGLEAAYVLKGFSLQSEYGYTMVDCAAGKCSDDPVMQAYYIDASYFFGGQRTYKKGLFGRDKVLHPASDGGAGALAISLRYDVSDLDDGLVNGGTQESVVLGATWYRDKYVRLMGNFAHSEFDDSAAYGNGSSDAFMLRAQIELY